MGKGVAICSLLILAISFNSSGQGTYSGLKELYALVEKADSISNKSTKTFYLEKFLSDNYNYKETWRYALSGGNIIYFEVDFILDSTEYTEVYYLKRGSLVCSEEYEKVNYSLKEDELRSGGIYYYKGNATQHKVMLGKKSFRYSPTPPEMIALSRFEKRFSELKRHLPMLPREL